MRSRHSAQLNLIFDEEPITVILKLTTVVGTPADADLVNLYANMGELMLGLTAYMLFYNEERVHQSLDYGTPSKVYPLLL